MFIRKHDESYLVELSDGSEWLIWPGDIAATLTWLPPSEIDVVKVEDEFCTHVLVDASSSLRVHVIRAGGHWPAEEVERFLEHG
jgi:hypothetical protein